VVKAYFNLRPNGQGGSGSESRSLLRQGGERGHWAKKGAGKGPPTLGAYGVMSCKPLMRSEGGERGNQENKGEVRTFRCKHTNLDLPDTAAETKRQKSIRPWGQVFHLQNKTRRAKRGKKDTQTGPKKTERFLGRLISFQRRRGRSSATNQTTEVDGSGCAESESLTQQNKAKKREENGKEGG